MLYHIIMTRNNMFGENFCQNILVIRTQRWSRIRHFLKKPIFGFSDSQNGYFPQKLKIVYD